ncbi:MAG: glutathione transferase GstA [Arenicella sp.]
MKLFYKPGACSLASHIILHEINKTAELEQVNTQTGLTEHGLDYSTINSNGYVPALQLDSGDILTEGASILQYLADQHPDSNLAPAYGTIARARLQEYLNYVSSELHKAFGPLFSDSSSEQDKQQAKQNVANKFNYLERLLEDNKPFLLGDKFSVADAYLFVVSNWSNFVGIELKQWPTILNYVNRIAQRPAVTAAMRAEGLIDA